MKKNEIILFESGDHAVSLPVNTDGETVWLALDQIAALFERDKSTISRHIRNVFSEGELDKNSVVANFATTAADGKTYHVDYYNLDVIISVGYRVKSQRGVEFRKWANQVLREYIIRGVAVNTKRMNQIGEVIRIMKRAENRLDAKQVLTVIEKYSSALDLLDAYDHETMQKPKGNAATYVLEYEECRSVIDQMKFAAESTLFGNEKDDSFKGSIANIYQVFGGVEIYPSLEEKAANLLYFIAKNHSFSDGKPAANATKAATAPKGTVKIQFGADEYDFTEIKKAVEADCKSKVKGKIKSIEIYIKPEDKAVYYVVNGDFSDKTDL